MCLNVLEHKHYKNFRQETTKAINVRVHLPSISKNNRHQGISSRKVQILGLTLIQWKEYQGVCESATQVGIRWAMCSHGGTRLRPMGSSNEVPRLRGSFFFLSASREC